MMIGSSIYSKSYGSSKGGLNFFTHSFSLFVLLKINNNRIKYVVVLLLRVEVAMMPKIVDLDEDGPLLLP